MLIPPHFNALLFHFNHIGSETRFFLLYHFRF